MLVGNEVVWGDVVVRVMVINTGEFDDGVARYALTIEGNYRVSTHDAAHGTVVNQHIPDDTDITYVLNLAFCREAIVAMANAQQEFQCSHFPVDLPIFRQVDAPGDFSTLTVDELGALRFR